jgi:hypothetical protein
MALHGKVANFYSHVSGLASHATLEAMSTIIGSGNNTYYVIDDPDKRYLPGTNITVYVGGVATSSDLYSVEKVGGRIIFTSVATGITIDCDYYGLAEIGGGFNWSLDVSNNLAESPTFGKEWMKRVPGLRDWNLTFDRYWSNNGFASLYERGGEDIFMVAYSDISVGGGTKRYEGKGKLDTMGVSAPSEELIEQSLTFMGEGTLYRREGSQ